MRPYTSKTPDEHDAEDAFIVEAKQRAEADLTVVRAMKTDSAAVAKSLRDQIEQNSWARTVKKALQGRDDD